MSHWEAAIHKANEFGDRIPIGVLYKNNRKPFGGHLPKDLAYPLGIEKVNSIAFEKVVKSYF